MKFALLFEGEAGDWFPEVAARLKADGSWRGGRRLAAGGTAVRIAEGGVAVTERMDAMRGETVGAFALVDAVDEAAALSVAVRAAEASETAVEVRRAAGQGEGTSVKAGMTEHRTVEGVTEFAFVMTLADENRPWPGEPAFDALMERCGVVLSRLEAAGRFRGTERLMPAPTAKTVRLRAGSKTVTDGPFSEARELIGGFILGECESRAEAEELAKLIPGARTGAVEVREALG